MPDSMHSGSGRWLRLLAALLLLACTSCAPLAPHAALQTSLAAGLSRGTDAAGGAAWQAGPALALALSSGDLLDQDAPAEARPIPTGAHASGPDTTRLGDRDAHRAAPLGVHASLRAAWLLPVREARAGTAGAWIARSWQAWTLGLGPLLRLGLGPRSALRASASLAGRLERREVRAGVLASIATGTGWHPAAGPALTLALELPGALALEFGAAWWALGPRPPGDTYGWLACGVGW